MRRATGRFRECAVLTCADCGCEAEYLVIATPPEYEAGGYLPSYGGDVEYPDGTDCLGCGRDVSAAIKAEILREFGVQL